MQLKLEFPEGERQTGNTCISASILDTNEIPNYALSGSTLVFAVDQLNDIIPNTVTYDWKWEF